jgi:hypothetical protein
MTETLCGCVTCYDARVPEQPFKWGFIHAGYGFRYACEICGNKRCPHHTDHTLACTSSNEPGQKGSIYE